MSQPHKENPFNLHGEPSETFSISPSQLHSSNSDPHIEEDHPFKPKPFWPWLVLSMLLGVALGVTLAMLLASGSLNLSSTDVREFFALFR